MTPRRAAYACRGSAATGMALKRPSQDRRTAEISGPVMSESSPPITAMASAGRLHGDERSGLERPWVVARTAWPSPRGPVASRRRVGAGAGREIHSFPDTSSSGIPTAAAAGLPTSSGIDQLDIAGLLHVRLRVFVVEP